MNKQPDYYFTGQKLRFRTDKKTFNQALSQTRSHYQLPCSQTSELTDSKVVSQVTPSLIRAQTRPINQIVPIPMDKEMLFDELQAQKKQCHQQALIIRGLKTNNSYLKGELNKYETGLIAPLKQATDETQMKSSLRLRNDQFIRLQRELLAKDRLIDSLKREARINRLEEMEAENRSLQTLNEELQIKLQKSLSIDNGAQGGLKRDNVEMAYLVKQQEMLIKDLQTKLQEESRKFQNAHFKQKGLKQLQQQQFQELIILKERDTLFTQTHQSRHQDNKILRHQIEQLQEEMNISNAQLTQTQSRLQIVEKRLRDTQLEAGDRIQSLESELSRSRKECASLKDELDIERSNLVQRSLQLQRKHSVMMNSYNVTPQPEENKYQPHSLHRRGSQLDPIHEELLQSTRTAPIDLQYLAKLIKYRLIYLQIDLKDIDNYLFSEENLASGEVFFGDLRVAMQHDAFGLREEAQFDVLARYLTDYDENARNVTVARVRSIFKTLMENYSLPKKEELVAIEGTLKAVIEKHRLDFLDYVVKKQGNHLGKQQYPLSDLLESFKAFDAPFASQHLNYFIAKIYGIHGDINIFEEKDLITIFEEHDGLKEDQQQFKQADSEGSFSQQGNPRVTVQKASVLYQDFIFPTEELKHHDLHQLDISHNPFENDSNMDDTEKEGNESDQGKEDVFKRVNSQESIEN